MTTVGDLALHYSTKAFQVRMAALTFSGAVLVAASEYFTDSADSNMIGAALILVVSSLSALNHRYTHSYLCACNAEAADLSGQGVPGAEPELRWAVFRHPNERPYRGWYPRLALSWSTFGPGVVGGVYLILRGDDEISWIGHAGIVVAAIAVALWCAAAGSSVDFRVDLAKNRNKY